MTQQSINIGTSPNDGSGDPLRTAFTKTNENFTEVYEIAQGAFDAANNVGNANTGDFKFEDDEIYTETGKFFIYTIGAGEDEDNVVEISSDNFRVNANKNITLVADEDINIISGNGTGSFKEWVFGANGNLELPAGGTIVEGVVTDNPTIELTPANPEAASQKLIIKGGFPIGQDYHVHLTTGDLGETSIFLGTDEQNVRTKTDGGVEITSYNYNNETSSVWSFDSEGDLTVPGAIKNVDVLYFDTEHVHQETRIPGALCWDPDDKTLNLTHPGDVVQQIGQETFGKVRNSTGATIPDGTAVRFDGASMNGTARLEVAPFLADGTFPSLYAFGITTQDIEDGEDGFVTVWGKVRDLDTTGGSENWQVGDILYVSPSVAGGLTKIKPTAPNNVVPMAAVLRVDATEGEIFVRPTIEQKKSYGRFARTTDLSGFGTNTATAVTFNTTSISNGVSLSDANTAIQVDQSGYYQISVSAQLDTNSNKGVAYMWLRRNGSDVPNTTRREAIQDSDDVRTFAYTQDLSLDNNDKIQLMVAVTNSDLRFDAANATAFAPSTSSFIVSVTQVQL